MPPGGCDAGVFNGDMFYEYEQPRALSQEESESRRTQATTLRLFQETLNQMRLLAEQIQEGLDYTARIQEEHRQIKRAMAKQKRLNRKRRRAMEDREKQRNMVIKAFFSCRERREAFPDLARKYLQSIS